MKFLASIWCFIFRKFIIYFVFSALPTAAFERACTLFNIAAMNSQIGALQNPEDDDGLKTAAKHFQVKSPEKEYNLSPLQVLKEGIWKFVACAIHTNSCSYGDSPHF